MKKYIIFLICSSTFFQLLPMNIIPQDIIVPTILLAANTIITMKDARVDNYLARLQERHPEWSEQLKNYSKLHSNAPWSASSYNICSCALIESNYLQPITAAGFTALSWCMVEERYKKIKKLEKHLEDQNNINETIHIVGEDEYNEWSHQQNF